MSPNQPAPGTEDPDNDPVVEPTGDYQGDVETQDPGDHDG